MRMEQAYRVLNIYSKLLKKQTVNKADLAKQFEVNPRTIQRDIDNIRYYLHEANLHSDIEEEITFDQSKNSYFIKSMHKNMGTPLQDTKVTYEITPHLYQKMKNNYDIKVLQRTSKSLTVEIEVSAREAIELCFNHRKSLRLISPTTLLNQFTTELIKLQMIYLRHEV